MIEFTLDYPEAVEELSIYFLPPELAEWVEQMDREGKLSEAVEELRSERTSYVKKIEEIDALIRALESRISNKEGSVSQTIVLHNTEFAKARIAAAAVTMIRRANKPLHVRDIMNGLRTGGYKFKARNPLDSVGPVLY